MMKRIVRLGFMAAALAAAPIATQAADLGRPYAPPPAYVEPFTWTGFYVGVNTGFMLGKSTWSGPSNFSVSPNGWLAGGTVGYNLQTGWWVWGVEGDIDYVSLKGTADAAVCSGCLFKDTWFGTVRGRVGYAAERWLPYFTGGLAFGNVYMQGPSGGSATSTKAGWTVGAGVEYAFARSWSAKLEYLYVDLGSAPCGMASCGFATDETINFTANVVRAGLNLRV